MEPKRRLPLLKSSGGGSEDGDSAPLRPPWQWVGFGALAIFVVWVPLAWLTSLAAIRLGQLGQPTPGVPLAVYSLLASSAGLAIAALAGGYLVGRWGTPGVGVREAALAGLAAALLATVLAWGSGPSFLGAVATVAIAVPPAALGGALGLRRRG
jgi:hypothetical protein